MMEIFAVIGVLTTLLVALYSMHCAIDFVVRLRNLLKRPERYVTYPTVVEMVSDLQSRIHKLEIKGSKKK